MIVAAAFCPHPPVLVPQVAQGAAHELDELRAACRAAVTRIEGPDRRIVVLGSGVRTRRHAAGAQGTFAGFGCPLDVGIGRAAARGPVELPLSVTVGAWLLRDVLGPDSDATACSVGPDLTDSDRAELAGVLSGDAETALLVMGDGSARRSTAAPGYLDERADGFDASVAQALADGDAPALATLDGELGRELLAAGVPTWRVAGRALTGTRCTAELLYDAAPYGVGYFVALWS